MNCIVPKPHLKAWLQVASSSSGKVVFPNHRSHVPICPPSSAHGSPSTPPKGEHQ